VTVGLFRSLLPITPPHLLITDNTILLENRTRFPRPPPPPPLVGCVVPVIEAAVIEFIIITDIIFFDVFVERCITVRR
jgi:hypothetical protein